MPQNHLLSLIKYSLLGPKPRVSDFVTMGWSPGEFAFLTNSQVAMMLLSQDHTLRCFRETLGLLDVFCCLFLVIVNVPVINIRMNQIVVVRQNEVLGGKK